MLTKDLLRVSRAGGGYSPQFVGESEEPLAARAVGIYQGHVGESHERLQASLTELERDAEEFKLVRGLAKLLDREATFETEAPLPPERARRVTFEAAESVGVVTESERSAAIEQAADALAVSAHDIEQSLYADRESRQVLTAVDPRWDPEALIQQYNLSLAQTALFDATEIRLQASDPATLVSAVKRLRLMYEIEPTDEGRVVVVTGPDRLFRRTRRYGTRFARLLRTVAGSADEWRLEATIDDRGTERTLELSQRDLSVPGVDPVTEVTYDSGVEADFAARFEALDLDWELTREPEPLEAGSRVMIPDFAFDYKYADFRVFFEIMGFWTPDYVEKKLDQLDTVEDVEMIVAVDDSLGVGEEIEARNHRAIPYSGSVRVKDVRNALRRYEAVLQADSAAGLPDEIVPDVDVITFEALASERGVSEDAIAEVAFPDHELVGRTLVRPDVLETLADSVETGMSLSAAEELFQERGITDSSATLSALGYRVEWEGLGGGAVRRAEE